MHQSPGVLPADGTVMLDTDERTRLEAGEIYLEIMTRDYPFGAARAPVALPNRSAGR